MYKIRTYNAISVKGLDRFPRAQFEVGSDVAHPDAFLLRSQKLHDESVPDTLLAAARAAGQQQKRCGRKYGTKPKTFRLHYSTGVSVALSKVRV